MQYGLQQLPKAFLLTAILAFAPAAAWSEPPAPAAPSSGTAETFDPQKIASTEAALIKALGAGLDRLTGLLDRVPNLDFTADLEALDNGHAGIRYDLDYSFDVGETDEKRSGSRAHLQFLSKGFVADDPSDTNDQIVGELRLNGELFGRDPGTYRKNDKDLAGFDAAAAVERAVASIAIDDIIAANTDAEKARGLERQIRDAVGRDVAYLTTGTSSRFVTFDGHAKVETDQNFDDVQSAVGLGVTTDLDVITGDDRLSRALDSPFRLLRTSDRKQVWIPAPRFYVGYDYVPDSELDWRDAITNDAEYHRIAYEAAWRTSIIRDVQLRFAWRALQEVNAPAAVRAVDKDWASYFEVSLAVPTGVAGMPIVISYSQGELPPSLDDEAIAGAGLRFDF